MTNHVMEESTMKAPAPLGRLHAHWVAGLGLGEEYKAVRTTIYSTLSLE